jgi:hypothetical protein
MLKMPEAGQVRPCRIDPEAWLGGGSLTTGAVGRQASYSEGVYSQQSEGGMVFEFGFTLQFNFVLFFRLRLENAVPIALLVKGFVGTSP